MGYEVTYEADRKLMRVRAWGHDRIDDWLEAKTKLLQTHEANGASILLVDVREQETSPDLFDILDFGDSWPASIRVALLVSKNTPKDMLYLETVAMQRGKQIRVFFGDPEALAWLDGGAAQRVDD
jgi:hypothetical protein